MEPLAKLRVPDPRDHDPQRVTAIKTPQEITCFSFDDNHVYVPDASSLRFYYTPEIGAAMSNGFRDFRNFDDGKDQHLDALLRAIQELEQRSGARVDHDFVTWRGMLTKIMTAPYDDTEFDMNATSFQGTIFIEEDKASKLLRSFDEAQRHKQNVPRSRFTSPELATFWGYKFETLSTLPAPWAECTRDQIEARPTDIVANAAQFCSVVASRIGAHSFVIGGEVDALWDVKQPCAPFPPDPTAPAPRRNNYVELKTATQPTGLGAHKGFEAKLLRFWAQSFLLGVPKIIVGWRSPGAGKNPILTSVQEFATTSIPRTIRESKRRAWESGVALAFLEDMLAFLKENIAGKDGVWRVALRRGVREGCVIRVERLEEHGHGKVVSEDFLRWRTGEGSRLGDKGEGSGGVVDKGDGIGAVDKSDGIGAVGKGQESDIVDKGEGSGAANKDETIATPDKDEAIGTSAKDEAIGTSAKDEEKHSAADKSEARAPTPPSC